MSLFLLKASLVTALLLLFYKLFLERESFFSANRIYLLGALVFACTLPFVALPQLVEHQGIVTSLLSASGAEAGSASTSTSMIALPTVPKTEKKAQTLEPTNMAPAAAQKNALSPTELYSAERDLESSQEQIAPSEKRGFGYWLLLLYGFGVVVLGGNLLAQVISTLWKVSAAADKIEDEGIVIVNLDGEVAPCSFFHYIFINPASYDYETYEQILHHEKIHVRMRHSIDLLLAEVATVFFWFNPFIWLLRKEVEKNLEYQTDDLLLQERRTDKETYQINLVKIATYAEPLAITTNYNQSLITQRILKMNAKKSNNYRYWKYSFVAPLLFLLLLVLNTPVQANEEEASELAALTVTQFWPEESTNTNRPAEPDSLTEPPAPTENALAPSLVAAADQGAAEREVSEPLDPAAPASIRESRMLLADCAVLTKVIREQNMAEIKSLLKTTDVDCVDPNPGYETVKEFDNGMSVRRTHARTPLTTAARVGNLEIVELLVDAGAEIDFRASNEDSPLAEAAYGGHKEVVDYLLEQGAKVNLFGGSYGSALSSAAAGGQAAIAKKLIEEGAQVNASGGAYGSPLSSAANNGHTETIKLLLAEGADINAGGGAYGTPLNTAANNGHTETIKLLLAKGADINASGGAYGTPLNTAANNGHTETIKLFLAEGADINAQGGAYGTALNTAAHNGHLAAVKLLVESGADITARGGAYGTALNTASSTGQRRVVDYLKSKGAKW